MSSTGGENASLFFGGPAAARLKKEIKEIMQTPLPGIIVVPDEENFSIIHACMVGPENTPYEGGLFNFRLNFPNGYPMCPPKVRFLTTGLGKVRMNPNLYECGKVCMSILGTWPGPKWTAACGLSSVLLSIHSLFTEQPIYNEPGQSRGGPHSQIYNRYVTHETIRVSGVMQLRHVIHQMSPLHPTIQKKIVSLFLQHSERYIAFCESLHKHDKTSEVIELYGKRITYQFAKLKTEVESCRKSCEEYLVKNPLEACEDIKQSETAESDEDFFINLASDTDYIEPYSEDEEYSDDEPLEDSNVKSEVSLQNEVEKHNPQS